MKMMILMKNANNAQLKHILIIKNAKIVIILGTLIYYKCIILVQHVMAVTLPIA